MYARFGFIGTWSLNRFHEFQNVEFIGNGKIKCVCETVTELNFEVIFDESIKFECEIVDNILTFSYTENNKEKQTLYSYREGHFPIVTLYYDDHYLIQKIDKWVLLDH